MATIEIAFEFHWFDTYFMPQSVLDVTVNARVENTDGNVTGKFQHYFSFILISLDSLFIILSDNSEEPKE